MPSNRWIALLLGGVLTTVPRAQAQAQAQAESRQETPAPATPSPEAEPTPALVAEVPQVSVSDPMLEPPAVPRRQLRSWDEAATWMRTRSTELSIVRDDVRRAEGQTRVALSGVLPFVSAQGVAAHRILPASGSTSSADANVADGANSLSARVSLSQPLVDARAIHGIGTAKMGEEIARLSVAGMQRELLANLASVIVASVAAERVAELSRQGLRSALERLSLTQAKERTGTGTGLDIVRAEQDVAATRAGIVDADEALTEAREALGLALGLNEPVSVAAGIDLAGIEQGALKSCESLANLEARADWQQAAKSVTLAARREREVDLGFLPTLAAQSALSTNASDAGGGFRTTWNIEAVLSIPIWDGGARYGEQTQARAATHQTQQQFEALKRTTRLRLVQAERAIGVATRARDVASAQRRLAAEVDRLTLSAYRTGKGMSLDLVVSAGALRQSELNLALSEFSLVRARLARLLELASCPGGQ